MSGTLKIYSLAHPITGEVRYVGVTSGTLSTRLAQHKWDAKNKMSHKCHWIKSVIAATNTMPHIELLEETSKTDWEWLEIYWIEQFRQWGFNLVNTSSGGNGVHIDVEGRQRSIDAHKKSIYQYDLDGTYIKEWESLVSACRFYKISDNAITSKSTKTAGGYRWSDIKVPTLGKLPGRSRSDQYRVTLTQDTTCEIIIFSSRCKAEKFLKANLRTLKPRVGNYTIEYTRT